ncbi:ParB N-terminal domain-containing protein [Desulfotomaculum sp. 1211_IL3151]|uniref:ParB N-terminal domain-containing protein n=1 Tax=Desulfotomaculum sp. 1211_IL3151 TaxID=3084055 RepID=UPI003FA5D2EC
MIIHSTLSGSYTGQRKDDMTESIRTKGILQPLILRAKDDGRYTVLAGHNRKYSGIDAGMDSAPVIIKYNLTDDDAHYSIKMHSRYINLTKSA